MNGIAVKAPGSCGELVQGELDGVRFHVSCPIDRYSRATIGPDARGRDIAMLGAKSEAALDAVVGKGRRDSIAHLIRLESELSSGVGMARSTADIGAIATAAALASGRRYTQLQLARLAVAIEPTDATLISGVCAFDHRSGRHFQSLGPAPGLAVSYVETGGSVDTVEFNTRKIVYTKSQKEKLGLAFDMVKAGIKKMDWGLLAAHRTSAAGSIKRFHPNPESSPALRLRKTTRPTV